MEFSKTIMYNFRASNFESGGSASDIPGSLKILRAGRVPYCLTVYCILSLSSLEMNLLNVHEKKYTTKFCKIRIFFLRSQ